MTEQLYSIVAQEPCLTSMHILIFNNGFSIRVQNISLLAVCAALADKTFGVSIYEMQFLSNVIYNTYNLSLSFFCFVLK